MNEADGQMQAEILKLSEALRLCQRELAQVRASQEPLQEECARSRAEGADAVVASRTLAGVLAEHASASYWAAHDPVPIGWRRFFGSRWPWLKRLFGGERSETAREKLQVRQIEGSPLFQSAWYLQHNLDVALAGMHPAAHYLHAGAAEGRDPGPDFDTRQYLREHPDAAAGGFNPLLHYIQSQAARGGHE